MDSSRTQRARQHHARALELYDAGALGESLREFRRAYGIMGDARLLFNIGQLELALGEPALARSSLERYLAEAKGSITAERRANVLQQLETLAEHTPSDMPAAEAGPDVAAEREPRHTSASGVSPRALKRSAVAAPAAEPGMPPLAAAAWISSGVLGLGALSTAVATVLASRRHSELRSSRSTLAEAPSARARLDRQRDLVQHLALATDVLALAAIGSAGLGLYFTLSDGGAPPARVSVELAAGNLLVAGSF